MPSLGGLGGGLSNINYKVIMNIILLLSGFLAVVFGLLLASRYFGFPLFFDLKMSDETLVKLASVVTIIVGFYTLVQEIRSGFGSGGDVAGLGKI